MKVSEYSDGGSLLTLLPAVHYLKTEQIHCDISVAVKDGSYFRGTDDMQMYGMSAWHKAVGQF
ncbi:hypothetical protein NLZ15_13105 [Atlantibacter subterranea]|uniref:hypothetical protein n=1 Tax=Atlantibacter subterraneus TaxID=255519 RepID=UPI0020C24A03|nr:hypothetical protein [Atlantibacter subterranea]UTJ45797.1 hypothetical protein NLZ15_13105 [Atlantibacter subterranea]